MQSSESSNSSFEVVVLPSCASKPISSSSSTAEQTPATESLKISGMPTTILKYKAAAVQSEPGWFDLEKSVQKTIDLINEAGDKGCKLIAFPETCMLLFMSR
jgi:hypothetical protein